MNRAGYLGPEGTFSHLALTAYAKKVSVDQAIPYPTFWDICQAYKNKALDMMILPVENMIEGQVNEPLDLLLSLDSGRITGEIIMPINHCLLAKKGTVKQDIQVVASHPQPLKQCYHYLLQSFPNPVVQITESSTSQAAKNVADNIYSKTAAAIGNELLADLYHLEKIEENIQDTPHNVTRFWIVSNHVTVTTGKDRTSFVFGTQKDEPGSLVRILNYFAMAEINLTKILSRPTKSTLGEYLFFVDCEGHIEDDKVKPVFEKVKQTAAYFKWLGSYPQGELS